MEKDNVYVLFEEIKNKIEMINGKLEQKAGTPTDGQAEEVIPTCVRHIHRHSFDIRSSKVFFSFGRNGCGMQPVLMGKYQTMAVQPAICRRRLEVPRHPFLERVYSGRYSLAEQGF